jgi:ribosomal protein S30
MLEQESVHVSLHAPSIPLSQHLQTSPRVANILEYPAIVSHTNNQQSYMYELYIILNINTKEEEEQKIIYNQEIN